MKTKKKAPTTTPNRKLLKKRVEGQEGITFRPLYLSKLSLIFVFPPFRLEYISQISKLLRTGITYPPLYLSELHTITMSIYMPRISSLMASFLKLLAHFLPPSNFSGWVRLSSQPKTIERHSWTIWN